VCVCVCVYSLLFFDMGLSARNKLIH